MVIAILSVILPVWLLHHVEALRIDPHFWSPNTNYKRPSRDCFGNRTAFAGMRGFGIQGNRIVDANETINQYVPEICDIIWPAYGTAFADNAADVAALTQQRGIPVTDFWGFVPGSGPGNGTEWRQGFSQEFRVDSLQSAPWEKGSRCDYFGFDVGEQDGRYVGRYADMVFPVVDSGVYQLPAFYRHFQAIGLSQGGKRLVVLQSLSLGHYIIDGGRGLGGTVTSIGCESAQALISGHVFYAVARGSGKRRKVSWFGNASVYNRWGSKSYPDRPTSGTSLSLMRRLLLSQLFYNSLYVSFEAGWFDGAALTPIGKIQSGLKNFFAHSPASVFPSACVHVAPVAIVTATFSHGWIPPRQLYNDKLWQTWGATPYGPADFALDGILNLLHPYYRDSSYFRDETGFMSPQPFGDVADLFNADVTVEELGRYGAVVIFADDALPTSLVLTLRNLSPNITVVLNGITLQSLTTAVRCDCGANLNAGDSVSFPADSTVPSPESEPRRVIEPHNITLCCLDHLPGSMHVVAREVTHNTPMVIAGRLWDSSDPGPMIVAVLAATGVPDGPVGTRSSWATSGIDIHLESPRPLSAFVSFTLSRYAFAASVPMVVQPFATLSSVTCRQGPGDWLVLVSNPVYSPVNGVNFLLAPPLGKLLSVEAIMLPSVPQNTPGYTPQGTSSAHLGVSNGSTIAGGDAVLYHVKSEYDAPLVSEVPWSPATSTTISPSPLLQAPVIVPVPQLADAASFFATSPSLNSFISGITLDWRVVLASTSNSFAEFTTAARGLAPRLDTVIVDFTTGINLWPDLRLIDNDPYWYAKSIDAITTTCSNLRNATEALANAIALEPSQGGAASKARGVVVLSLHGVPENQFSSSQTETSMTQTLARVASSLCPSLQIVLRVSPKNPFGANSATGLTAWLTKHSLQHVITVGDAIVEAAIASTPSDTAPSFLFVAAPVYDSLQLNIASRNSPLIRVLGGPFESFFAKQMQRYAALCSSPSSGTTFVLDAVFGSASLNDAVFLELYVMAYLAGCRGTHRDVLALYE